MAVRVFFVWLGSVWVNTHAVATSEDLSSNHKRDKEIRIACSYPFKSNPTLAFSCGARSASDLKEKGYLRSTLSRRQLQGFVGHRLGKLLGLFMPIAEARRALSSRWASQLSPAKGTWRSRALRKSRATIGMTGPDLSPPFRALCPFKNDFQC